MARTFYLKMLADPGSSVVSFRAIDQAAQTQVGSDTIATRVAGTATQFAATVAEVTTEDIVEQWFADGVELATVDDVSVQSGNVASTPYLGMGLG